LAAKTYDYSGGIEAKVISVQPRIFISATCYDLEQIRGGLCSFLSESYSIPVVCEDCETSPLPASGGEGRVEGDLLVLVVGGRFDDRLDDEARHQGEVMNKELEVASGLGLPVVAFVRKDVLDCLRMWRSKPGVDYSFVVDSPKIFAFVESLMGTASAVLEFVALSDIIRAMRKRLP
jgi:hypothetical protein